MKVEAGLYRKKSFLFLGSRLDTFRAWPAHSRGHRAPGGGWCREPYIGDDAGYLFPGASSAVTGITPSSATRLAITSIAAL